MPTSTKLPKSWPPIARDILVDAARYYYREMKEPWPVPDVIMERAVEWANKELDARRREVVEEATLRWIDRWDHGLLEADMKKAIEETYRRLSRAEGAIRPRAGARKKSPRQLDAEIAQALSARSRQLGTTVLGRGMITEEQARALSRFEFIAHWLAVVTKKKENRGPLGLYVKHAGKRWQVVSPVGGGTVTYETADPALLFDYARRGQLGSHIRDAEEFRGLAYQRAEVG